MPIAECGLRIVNTHKNHPIQLNPTNIPHGEKHSVSPQSQVVKRLLAGRQVSRKGRKTKSPSLLRIGFVFHPPNPHWI